MTCLQFKVSYFQIGGNKVQPYMYVLGTMPRAGLSCQENTCGLHVHQTDPILSCTQLFKWVMQSLKENRLDANKNS